jgi:hypothetical protein
MRLRAGERAAPAPSTTTESLDALASERERNGLSRLAPSGPEADTDRWCYQLTGSSGTVNILWTNFNPYCWGGAGTTYYSGQTLTEVTLIVPGDDTLSVSFSICLNSMAPY